MRQANGYVYFTKKEERAVFRCYFEAIGKARFDGQRKNLDYVRRYLIEGVGTLTVEVWENFTEVLIQLGCDVNELCDILKEHPSDPGKGACYRIPNKSKDAAGHMKAMAKRRQWRNHFIEYFEMCGTGPKMSLDELRVHANRIKLRVIDGGVS